MRICTTLASRLAACATAMICGLAVTAAAAEPARLHEARLSAICRLMQVDTVQFEPSRDGWSLYIAGLKDFANMDVGLENRVGPQGQWTLEVVGCTPNFIGLPIRTPYWLDVPLSQFPHARSIRIVGSNGVWRPRLPRR